MLRDVPRLGPKNANSSVFDFLKTYLYALYTRVLQASDIKVQTLHAMGSINYPVMSMPKAVFQTESGLAKIANSYVYALVSYAGADYYINLIRMNHEMRGLVHELVVSGISDASKRPDILRDLLIHGAINNSLYKGRILRVVEAPGMSDDENPVGIEVEIVKDIKQSNLEDVFLPKAVSRELRRFMECAVRYDELGTALRYLLSGPPGTAKTMVVRSIAKACEGKVTVILASGGDSRLNKLFSFASIFKPAILCIDDIDLVVGDRHNMAFKSVLGTFLQKLDGFLGNHLFVLATTNDKRSVDMAASRPGRFDQIIDMGALEPRNYLDLVKRRTQDPELLALFGDMEVLALLREKNIVGAFLANLVKQADISKKTNGKAGLSKKELLAIINRSHRGFYEEPSKGNIGFAGRGGEQDELDQKEAELEAETVALEAEFGGSDHPRHN